MSCKERLLESNEAKSYLAAADRISQFLTESKVPDEWYSLPRKLVLRKQVLNEVRPVVDSAELTALHVFNQMTTVVLFFPLRLHSVNELACASLGKLKNLTRCKQTIIEWFYQLTPDRLMSAPFKDEKKTFYLDLLRFVSAARDLAAGGLRSNLSFFINTQPTLLKRIEGVLTTLHADEVVARVDKKFDLDFVERMQKVKQVFEDAIKQQNDVVDRALKGKLSHNPLEAVWKHLHKIAQKLSPNGDFIKALHNKIGLFQDILKDSTEQLKLARKDPKQAFVAMKTSIYGCIISIMRDWLPQFAMNGIQMLTGLKLESEPNEYTTVYMDSKKYNDKKIITVPSDKKPEIQKLSLCTKKVAKHTGKKSVTIVEPFEMSIG
ncbi:hypothetical protein BIW11_05246 [Tropilaelaps mercedesae]|uniref:Uncharacterized protein n=1 Tax=Tropilaelaps mercedesae TaxID=418985 RepID=A0A1V9Y378_9ACAR|nr:hypothetical protein BIW11_05246 [Tropilaelaps mercedesae]